jgi:Arc/MetJ-type ribon-helix-helix transcriptional regulator
MANATLNVSLSEEQLAQLDRELDSGQYVSAGEIVREALREWLKRRIAEDVAALEKAHAGAWRRDTTPEELEAILEAKRRARAKLASAKPSRPRRA